MASPQLLQKENVGGVNHFIIWLNMQFLGVFVPLNSLDFIMLIPSTFSGLPNRVFQY